MVGGPTFDEVKAAALDQIETLCAKLLPNGKRAGQWWVDRVPWRDDRKPSLAVSLTTGNYKDWGDADGGTIIDLVMRLDRCDANAARETLAGLLGLDMTPGAIRPIRHDPVSCAGCKWLWDRFPWADYCATVLDPMTEEPRPIADARRAGGQCGTHAKLYQVA